MSARGLDLVFGPAIDDPKTKVCHQITSVSYDLDKQFKTLHYTVFCPSLGNDPNDLLDQNLVDILSDKRALKTSAGKSRAHMVFGQFLCRLKPTRQTGFVLGRESLSLTYDINFNNKYQITSIGLRPTLGVMTEQLSYQQAKQKTSTKPCNTELKLWHDLMYRQKDFCSDDIGFEKVINTTTEIIQKKMCQYALQNDLACIYRINYGGKKSRDQRRAAKERTHFYGSTLDENFKSNACLVNRFLIPATASRSPIDCMNIVSAAEFAHSKRQIFSSDVIQAIATYKTLRA